jgi:hypothetical protein
MSGIFKIYVDVFRKTMYNTGSVEKCRRGGSARCILIPRVSL